MKWNKKKLAIAASVVGLFLFINVSVALYLMTVQVDIGGGVVATEGTIAVYQADGVTPLVSYDFPNFTGGYPYQWPINFFINNTGGIPVYVYWNISASSIDWTWETTQYRYYEAATAKYGYQILQDWSGPNDYWDADTEAIILAVDEGVELRMRLLYTGEPNTSEAFTLTESFYAYDS